MKGRPTQNLFFPRCGRQRNAPPKDAHVLTPEPCEYVLLHDKGESQLTLQWGGHSRTSDGLSVVTSVLRKERRRKESQNQGRCDDQAEAEVMPSLALKKEDGTTSHGMQAPLEVGKGKKRHSFLELLGGTQAALLTSRFYSHNTSNLQKNCKIINNSCCFRPVFYNKSLNIFLLLDLFL